MTPKEKAKEVYLDHKRKMAAMEAAEKSLGIGPKSNLLHIPDAVTVYCQGESIALFPEIAAEFGLTEGDSIASLDTAAIVKVVNIQFGLAQIELDLNIRSDFDSKIETK